MPNCDPHCISLDPFQKKECMIVSCNNNIKNYKTLLQVLKIVILIIQPIPETQPWWLGGRALAS